MPGKGGRATALRADAARNRARVLQVAREQVAAGDDSLQLNLIARIAGVGVGTVYRHFPTPQALLEALAGDRFEQLAVEIRTVAADPDAAAGLCRLLRFVLRCALADPGFAMMLRAAGDVGPETAAIKAQLDDATAALLERGRCAGAIRDGIAAPDVHRLLCGIVHAVRAGGEPDDDVAGLYLEIVLQGLRPPLR